MVIVVPSLSKGDEREDKAVLAVVSRLESGLSDDVGKRVDAECSMVQERCADAEAPGEHLKRPCAEPWVVGLKEVAKGNEYSSEHHGWNDVVLVEKSKLRKLEEVFYILVTGLNELCTEYPSHVSPPKAVDAWWMDILLSIGVLVVMPVVRRPPDRPLLRGCCSKEPEYKLK